MLVFECGCLLAAVILARDRKSVATYAIINPFLHSPFWRLISGFFVMCFGLFDAFDFLTLSLAFQSSPSAMGTGSVLTSLEVASGTSTSIPD